jgi:hypothetical protein
MTNLFDPPQIFTLPLTKGRDLFCEFVYEPLVVDGNGDPILDGQGQPQYAPADYPAGATVQLVIDVDPAVTGDADISGDTATVLIDHLEVDPIPLAKLWRLEITYSNAVDDVLCNGTTVRSDGKVSK